MAVPQGESIWKLLAGAVVLVFFLCISPAHVLYPNRFLKRSGVRPGGEVLIEFNRMGFAAA